MDSLMKALEDVVGASDRKIMSVFMDECAICQPGSGDARAQAVKRLNNGLKSNLSAAEEARKVIMLINKEINP